ncbi:MAG: hypothetical protein PHG82_00790 [Candidatus Gracilibacteria bacterium]|nr:hypothetical protein [Candidatus Gracilibacteria bacterium]
MLDFFESQEIASMEVGYGFSPKKIEETQNGVKGKVEIIGENRIKLNLSEEEYKELVDIIYKIKKNGDSISLKELHDKFGYMYMPGMRIYDYMENLVSIGTISATGWKADRVYVESKN